MIFSHFSSSSWHLGHVNVGDEKLLNLYLKPYIWINMHKNCLIMLIANFVNIIKKSLRNWENTKSMLLFEKKRLYQNLDWDMSCLMALRYFIRRFMSRELHLAHYGLRSICTIREYFIAYMSNVTWTDFDAISQSHRWMQFQYMIKLKYIIITVYQNERNAIIYFI